MACVQKTVSLGRILSIRGLGESKECHERSEKVSDDLVLIVDGCGWKQVLRLPHSCLIGHLVAENAGKKQ